MALGFAELFARSTSARCSGDDERSVVHRFVAEDARELRDRWLEKVNSDRSVLSSNGKYEVSRSLVAPAAPVAADIPLLEAA